MGNFMLSIIASFAIAKACRRLKSRISYFENFICKPKLNAHRFVVFVPIEACINWIPTRGRFFSWPILIRFLCGWSISSCALFHMNETWKCLPLICFWDCGAFFVVAQKTIFTQTSVNLVKFPPGQVKLFMSLVFSYLMTSKWMNMATGNIITVTS